MFRLTITQRPVLRHWDSIVLHMFPSPGLSPSCSPLSRGQQEPHCFAALCSPLSVSCTLNSCWRTSSPRDGGVDAVLVIFNSKQSQEERRGKKKKEHKPTHRASQLPPCTNSARDGLKRNRHRVGKCCNETRAWEETTARIT